MAGYRFGFGPVGGTLGFDRLTRARVADCGFADFPAGW